MSLSVAFGANNARASAGVLSMLSTLQSTGEVYSTVPVAFRWRLMSAFGMAAGALLLGYRLVPITGDAGNLMCHAVCLCTCTADLFGISNDSLSGSE